jgi:copper chaperone
LEGQEAEIRSMSLDLAMVGSSIFHSTITEGTDAMKLRVEDMTCGGCVKGVTKAVQKVDPGATVSADLEARTVEVATEVPREAIVTAIGNAGFTVTAE